MENTQTVATHDGEVLAVRPGTVQVRIEAVSACASCAAHGKCGFAESKDKTLDIPTTRWQDYSPGQPVTVTIDESHGMLAVWIAYVLPALLMLAVIITLSLLHLPEWTVVTGAFAILGLYILFLYLRRRHVEGKFTLTISPHKP